DKNRDLYAPMEILDQALLLEQMLVSLINDLSESGVYEVIAREEISAEAFEKLTHWYKDHRVARLWNTMRMTRLFVNEVLHEQSSILIGTQKSTESTLWDSWTTIHLLAPQT